MKHAIMQVTYFLNGSVVNMLLRSYIERKLLLKRNLATILPLKFKLSGKFQRFNAINGSIQMLKNSPISKNFNYSVKFQTFYESQTMICQKSFLRLWNKSLRTEIYRNISKCFENAALECSTNVFSHTNQKNVFGCVAGVFFYNTE